MASIEPTMEKSSQLSQIMNSCLAFINSEEIQHKIRAIKGPHKLESLTTTSLAFSFNIHSDITHTELLTLSEVLLTDLSKYDNVELSYCNRLPKSKHWTIEIFLGCFDEARRHVPGHSMSSARHIYY
jgi:hypothetical protein